MGFPYQLNFQDSFEQIVLRVTADQLFTEFRHIQNLIAKPIDGQSGAGFLFLQLMSSLIHELSGDAALSTQQMTGIKRGLFELLAATLATEQQSTPTPSLELYHIERIKRHINARLMDADLTIKTIAQELNISTSYLHRLFQSQEISASQYLWRQRLEACRQDLSDTQHQLSISQIAYKWGFNDAAHFRPQFQDTIRLLA